MSFDLLVGYTGRVSRNDDDWREHLESVTRSGTGIGRSSSVLRIPTCTILCHPNPKRVGEQAVLEPLIAGHDVELSRLGPDFVSTQDGARRPLADARLSRRPWRLLARKDGALALDPGGTRTAPEVDGELLTEVRELGSEELLRGVVLLLARRVALLLSSLEPVVPMSFDPKLVGESPALVRVRREIEQLADTPYPVLLRGESGTGKELVARALHDRSPRHAGPYVAVNMGTIPRELAAAELFGAARGAYTGAHRSRQGYFRQASGGTLFLDEIGAAPAEVQVHLLRTLETGLVQPLGAEEPEKVNVRVISATDADLESAAAVGEFRSPLLHRLGTCGIRLPALRDRREDLGRLFFHFLREELRVVGEDGRLGAAGPDERPFVPAAFVARLAAHGWPGNVRQLRNVVRQLVLASRGRAELQTSAPELEEEAPPPLSGPAETSRKSSYRPPWDVDDEELLTALRDERWNVNRAAGRLGVSRPALYKRMDQCPRIRKAGDLSREEIEAVRDRFAGKIDQMAEALEVSPRGLQLRMRSLGLR